MEMTEKIKITTAEQTNSARLVAQSIEDVSTMTAQIFKASEEQTNATKSIGDALESIKKMVHEMATATGSQVKDTSEIKKSVDAFGLMVTAIFEDMEKRRQESGSVMRELQILKESSG
jgi:methyl-accepting chemotaxis protein